MASLFARRSLTGVRHPFSRTALLAAAVLAAVAAGSTAAASSAQPRASGMARRASIASNVRSACGAVTRQTSVTCLALVRTDIRQRTAASLKGAAPVGFGYGPADLQNAYHLPSATAGAGQSVAIIAAFDDPNAASDLAVYRSAWGLPGCDTATGAGCVTKINQYGQASPLPAPSGTTGWATEESLNLDMISAVCPLCHIYLMEASKPIWFALGHGINSVIALGARYVDNPYTARQYFRDPSFDTMYYQHSGDAIVAAAGNIGDIAGYPAASQYVTSAGGTSLLPDTATARGWSEHVWGAASSHLGTGSGCSSKFEPKPPWQTPGCARRADNDVSAVANPHDGVAVYDTYDQHGWLESGGTGASASIITAAYALAGPPAAGTYPASYPYAHPQALFDVTIGSNGTCNRFLQLLCNAQPGYDGPSGLGSPDGVYAFGFHG